jgi:hypothetical protein
MNRYAHASASSIARDGWYAVAVVVAITAAACSGSPRQ